MGSLLQLLTRAARGKLMVWSVLALTAGALANSIARPGSAAGAGPVTNLPNVDVAQGLRGTTLEAPPGAVAANARGAHWRGYNAPASGKGATASVFYDALTGLG